MTSIANGSDAQISQKSDEFLNFISRIPSDIIRGVTARFLISILKEKSKDLPSLGISQNYSVGVGLIEFRFILSENGTRRYWVTFSNFKGLGITPEDEFDYLNKYGVEYVKEVEQVIGIPITIERDPVDLLVEDPKDYQWTFMS